jgi:hypothetical protein
MDFKLEIYFAIKIVTETFFRLHRGEEGGKKEKMFTWNGSFAKFKVAPGVELLTQIAFMPSIIYQLFLRGEKLFH